MNEFKGLNIILISEYYDAVYSGMTPGFIRKIYSREDISIDLQRLCFNAGATFIKDQVISLDSQNQILHIKDNPPISYDVLSINSGSISNNKTIELEKNSNVIPVKPISSLVSKLDYIDNIIEPSSHKKVSIVGGGVAAFELSFALYKRYEGNIALNIISSSFLDEKNLNLSSIKKLKEIANKLSINLISNQVVTIDNLELKFDNENKIKSDLILLSTGASLPDWLAKSNLEKTENFIAINEHLQSLNFKNIFISGDAATIQNLKKPKSGVMAVRQGEILKDNLFLFLQNKTLKKFKPQKNWLYLIGTHKNSAIFNYFNFIKKFSFKNKTDMNKKKYVLSISKQNKSKMYCQGCGSKVSKNTLVNFLSDQKSNKELSDATEIKFEQNNILQTIDHIKLFK